MKGTVAAIAAVLLAASLLAPSGRAAESEGAAPPNARGEDSSPMYRGGPAVAGFFIGDSQQSGYLEVFLYRHGSTWVARSIGADPTHQIKVHWATSRSCPGLRNVVRKLTRMFEQPPGAHDLGSIDGAVVDVWRARGLRAGGRIEELSAGDEAMEAFAEDAPRLLERCWREREPRV